MAPLIPMNSGIYLLYMSYFLKNIILSLSQGLLTYRHSSIIVAFATPQRKAVSISISISVSVSITMLLIASVLLILTAPSRL